ncbi:MAG: glycoside hydrolase family 3 N-terminal domain-containing protein [Bryobacteraceae bacterium]
MTLRDLVAQLIVITSYGEAPSSRSAAYRDFVHQVRDVKVGGIIVVNRVVNGSVRNAEPFAMASFLNRLQRFAKVPLIVGADFERGASMRVSGTTKFPHMMAYGAARDLALTRYLGAATAREARALGVQWVFAPDADVNNNPDNPIINMRSFGENPQDVAAQVKAFIEGAHAGANERVLVTVKHFPGHGDTNVDSHVGMPSLTGDRARMDALELVPFRAAIASGVDAVMTGHIAVPAMEKPEIPATISPALLTGLLRNDLKFNGLIVTDAMDMQGLTRQFPSGESSVRALEAGADVLLMPSNPEEVIRAVLNAVHAGRLSRKRIEDSAAKVLAAKVRVGLDKNKLVNLEEISDVIEAPEAVEKAQETADRAITLVKNTDAALPLKNPEKACWYILTESRSGQQGRRLQDELLKRSRDTRFALLDAVAPGIELDLAVQKMQGCETNVVAAFVSSSEYRGKAPMAGSFPSLMTTLLEAKTPLVLVALGSPYLLRSFPGVGAYMTTYTVVPPAEASVVKALYGEMPITGKLPVSIPGLAAYGDGIVISKR